MYTVTVLTPKGRRQQVKVTPNTTLLQILEEVCVKHGFNAQEYDLRFTSLPNNAQLEMTEALRQRQESPVTLGLQFETGERLTGVFSPSESVWNVIVNLKPEEEESDNLVVIYMRQEIYGLESLKMTTLRSLGLTSGRAMLRVLHKSPEELHMQANVSSALPLTSISEKLEDRDTKEASKSPELPKKGGKNEKPKLYSPEPASWKNPSPEPLKKEAKYTDGAKLRGNVFENLLKDERSKRAVLLDSRKKSTEATKTFSTSKDVEVENVKVKSSPESEVRTETSVPKKMTITDENLKESKVILLGERNAVAFNLNSVKPAKFEEEPDDFYDLTIYDAKLLLKQAKQLCAELEDAPLMTSAQRELEKDKKVLSLLHQYKKTVLRVKFPDRTVLQGTFSSLETVSAVEKFVSVYLESPTLQFYLYTTPPKVILKSDTRLIECGCVPSCVLYFGMPPEVEPPSQYLKSEVLEKLSTPSAAALHAYETRGVERKIRANETEGLSERENKWSKDANSSEAGPSGSQEWENDPRDHETSLRVKLPKWFRANK